VQKNEEGSFVLPDIADAELSRIIEECETELTKGVGR